MPQFEPSLYTTPLPSHCGTFLSKGTSGRFFDFARNDIVFCLVGNKYSTMFGEKGVAQNFYEQNGVAYNENERRRTCRTSSEFEEAGCVILPYNIATPTFESNENFRGAYIRNDSSNNSRAKCLYPTNNNRAHRF